VQNIGAEFIEEAEEVAFLQEEPRTLAEILEAEKEFFDKIWYVRARTACLAGRTSSAVPAISLAGLKSRWSGRCCSTAAAPRSVNRRR
jgi:hypothetical protein